MVPEKQYYGLNKVHIFDKEDDKAMKEPELNRYKESDLAYNNRDGFCKYLHFIKFNRNSIEEKNGDLELGKFNSIEPGKERTKEKNIWIKNYALKCYNDLLEICISLFHFFSFSFFKIKNLGPEYERERLFLNNHDYNVCYIELDDKTW